MKAEPSNYLCLAWLSEDRLVLGTDTGKVQLFEVGELKNEFNVMLPTASEEEATSTTASRRSLQRYMYMYVVTTRTERLEGYLPYIGR